MISENIKYIDINIKNKTPLDYLELILEKEIVKSISIVVFSCGVKPINRFEKMIKNKEIKVVFYVSSFLKRMIKTTYKKIKSLKSENLKIKLLDTHCKIILIKTIRNHYVIISSSNLDSNTKLEITEIDNNKEGYYFFEKFLQKNSRYEEN